MGNINGNGNGENVNGNWNGENINGEKQIDNQMKIHNGEIK